MKKRIATLVCMGLFAIGAVQALDEGAQTYIMYGSGQSYVIVLNSGWQMMMEYGQKVVGVDNFFIPEGFTPNDAPVGVMAYVGAEYETLGDFIEYDIKTFTDRNPSFTAEEISIDTESAEADEVYCYLFSSNESTVKQYIAYFSASHTTFCFALAFQVFDDSAEYYDEFLFAARNSHVSPVNFVIQE